MTQIVRVTKKIYGNMKVLVDNYSKTRTVTCPGCKSVLEVTVKDLHSDVDGETFLKCPLCGRTWGVTKENLKETSSVRIEHCISNTQ